MFNEKYPLYLERVNKELEKVFDSLSNDAPEIIKEAMRYAVEGGGKRIRPVLLLSVADALGVDQKKALPFAVSVEMIHSYSLVHDDLPSMDNDDFRRGKLSTHKKFGEALGVLSGDALLNFAFEYPLSIITDINEIKALSLLAEYSGYRGMIKGQVLDLEYEKKLADEEILEQIHLNKTAKLLTVPLLIASLLADGKYYEELKAFGNDLGILFQITDDILDVEGSFSLIGKTPKKDESEEKLTAVKIFGLDGAKKKAEEYYRKCLKTLSKINGMEFLTELTENIYIRKK